MKKNSTDITQILLSKAFLLTVINPYWIIFLYILDLKKNQVYNLAYHTLYSNVLFYLKFEIVKIISLDK